MCKIIDGCVRVVAVGGHVNIMAANRARPRPYFLGRPRSLFTRSTWRPDYGHSDVHNNGASVGLVTTP